MMRAAAHNMRGRSGITLTEILISLLIMTIGLVSLASLFPLGLLRIRAAQRDTRSAVATNNALGDIAGRNLLDTRYQAACPWHYDTTWGFIDPWIQDVPLPTGGTFTVNGNTFLVPNGVYRGFGFDGTPTRTTNQPYIAGEGLPVAYDPLWWIALRNQESTTVPGPTVGRFGFGLGQIASRDPNPVGTSSTAPSAYGLQRITGWPFFNTTSAGTLATSYQYAADVFTSPDDPVLQTEGDANLAVGATEAGALSASGGSPVLPYLDANGNMTYDWTYSWIFTGRRSGMAEGSCYVGDVVVFHNRPFGYDAVGDVTTPAGERVVEAVFGYGTTTIGGNSPGFSPNDTSILLRWPASLPDPDVRVGGWIADVTYERFSAESDGTLADGYTTGRFSLQPYPGQRCNWYRVSKKSDAEGETPGVTSAPADAKYRRMVLTVSSPLKAKTLITPGGTPVHINAALVMPTVVNVFPKVFYTR